VRSVRRPKREEYKNVRHWVVGIGEEGRKVGMGNGGRKIGIVLPPDLEGGRLKAPAED